MDYTRKAIKGISWMSGLQFTVRVLSVLRTAILARVLSPPQFGVFGIATLVLAFYELLTETGINIVLIQSKRDLPSYIDSAWVVSIIRGSGITLLMIISSPLIAAFFRVPDSIGILLFMSIVPFVRGFINPSIVKFQKNLAFHYEFWFRSSLFFFDAIVSILLAILTHSVYSLAWGLLAGAILEVLLSLVLIRPCPTLSIHKEYLREIFHKGKWITLYGVLDYFGKQGDNIVVGRFLGAGSLGIYQVAYRLSTLALTEITEVISKVFFPLYSQIAENRNRLKSVFLKSTIALSFVVVPTSLIIFFYSKEIVLLALGDKWIGAVPVLRILAFYGMVRAIVSYPSSLFLALNHQKYIAFTTFVRALTLASTIVPLIYAYGIVGAGISAVVSVIIEVPLIVYLLIKIFKNS